MLTCWMSVVCTPNISADSVPLRPSCLNLGCIEFVTKQLLGCKCTDQGANEIIVPRSNFRLTAVQTGTVALRRPETCPSRKVSILFRQLAFNRQRGLTKTERLRAITWRP